MNLDDLIIPSDDSPLDQSNIFKKIEFPLLKKECLGILLTPVCDLAHNNNNAIICPVVDYIAFFPTAFEQFLHRSFKDLVNGKCNKETEDEVKKSLIENFLNNRHLKFHWLGRLPERTSFWYVDFRVTTCLKVSELPLENRIAIAKSPLRESIPAMYSNYINRVGLPWEREERLDFADIILSEIKKGYPKT